MNINISIFESVNIEWFIITSEGIRKCENSFKYFKKINKRIFSENFVFNFGKGGFFEFRWDKRWLDIVYYIYYRGIRREGILIFNTFDNSNIYLFIINSPSTYLRFGYNDLYQLKIYKFNFNKSLML